MKRWIGRARLVLDTNICISGFINRYGNPGRLLRGARRVGRFVPVTSKAQLEELARVLTYERFKGRIDHEQAADFVRNLPVIAAVAHDLPEVSFSPDPDDNAIIATAIAGKADLIVTGDKRDLLSLDEAAGIPILTARQALIRLGEAERGKP